MKRSAKKSLLRFLLLIGILAFIVLAVQMRQNIQNKAASPPGTERVFLNPGSRSFPPLSPVALSINTQLTGIPIDGIQIVLDVTGAMPTNLALAPAAIPGFTLAQSTVTTTATGRRIVLAYITTDPAAPYTRVVLLTLGRITFVGPKSGTTTFMFNEQLTKILRHGGGENIVARDFGGTYTFQGVTRPRPTPTPDLRHTQPTLIPKPRPSGIVVPM